MEQEPGAAEDVRVALERTVQRGSARMRLEYQSAPPNFDLRERRRSRPQGDSRSRRWGSAAGRLLLSGMFSLVRRLARKIGAPQSIAIGVIDFAAHRCMFLHPGEARAVVIAEDQRRGGAPGTPLDRLTAAPASSLDPLWLVDIVRGVIDVGQPAADDIAGEPCRRFAAHADLLRAADAVSYQLAVPPGMDKVDDLRRIPVEVWVGDDGYIRRVRHTSGRRNQPYGTSTLDLTELGVELPLDWSQLPELPTLDASPDKPHLVGRPQSFDREWHGQAAIRSLRSAAMRRWSRWGPLQYCVWSAMALASAFQPEHNTHSMRDENAQS